MTYERPEITVLGSAASTIQSSKPIVGEPTLHDPAPQPDSQLAD